MTFVEFEWLFMAVMAALIAFAFGDQRGRERMKVKRQQLTDRTAEAAKRRWVENGLALELFERAFSDRTGSGARECACGIQFYNPDNGWQFDEGELELYRADPKSRALEWAVGCVYFEGRYFVTDCDCWHPRARKIVEFLHHHDDQIAEFLSLEKASLARAAENAPVVAGRVH